MTLQPNSEHQSFEQTPPAESHRAKPEAISSAGIVTVRPDAETLTRQRLPYFVGISGATAGAQGISMNLVIIPPGGAAEPHFHRDYETAIYLIKGRVETRYGQGLKQSVINEAGDFIFIPPGVPHQPFNLDKTEPAQALVARNDPNEQENVVLYDPTQPSA
jgi:uncharacterized RmlC-like cupin family protein